MAKKEKDLKQEKPTEEATKNTESTEKTTETTEKPTKETKKCARCGAELISGKTECPVCLAPVNWER